MICMLVHLCIWEIISDNINIISKYGNTERVREPIWYDMYWPGKKRSRGEFFNGGPHSKGVNHRGGPPSDLLINSFDRSKYSFNTLPFFSSSSTLAATSASPNSSHFSDKRRVVRVGIGVAVAVGVGVWLVETASRRNEIGFDLLNFPTNGVKSRRTAVDKLAGKVETPVTAMEMLVNSAAHKRYRE